MDILACLGSLVGALLADDEGTGIGVVSRRRASAALLNLRLLGSCLECSTRGTGATDRDHQRTHPLGLGLRDPVRERVEARQREGADG